jgi:hypothetical protein
MLAVAALAPTRPRGWTKRARWRWVAAGAALLVAVAQALGPLLAAA